MKHFYPSLLLFFVLAIAAPQLQAQEKAILPKGLSENEKGLISQFEFSQAKKTPPPTGPVRTMAEWEEVEYLLITWQPGFQNILRQIVAVGVNECKVVITTQNQASVASFLTAGGIDLTNVIFMNEDWDSIWIRDYAGNTIYSNDVGERALTDWIYNRPRPNDNVMPLAHANLVGLPIYVTDSGTNDLVNTGGNFMSDGLGNAFASELILEENEAGNPYGVSTKTEAQIDAIMEDYMGIQRYVKMETLPYDGIHHIDMHMKLLDEETLLVSEYPDGVADGPQIEQNIEYVLNNFQSAFGTPYDVKWIPAPPSTGGNYPDTGGYYRTFTNAVFVNKSIIIPTYRAEVDGPALAYWQELMPGYNIVGIDVDNSGENLISQLGAIHCITHTIGVENPLWIVHQPIDEANQNSTVSIDAMIKHASGISNAKVFWREEGSSSYSEVPMSLVSADNWTANLSVGSSAIEYYIFAEANSGKTMTRPMVAPQGYWTMNVGILGVSEWAYNNISAPFPNPTRDAVSFNLNNIPGAIKITIHNILGQRLYETTIDHGNGTISLDLNANWKGTLFVTFQGEFGTVTKKVIKL
ncbi:agmatine deiminase family protein [Altibacter sp.]|uniref:agmatine deiminase family protein n=1 Tax=Altibacter sp. TaxID=2024823 RepID=UPI002583CDA1|nr:agmatine deiminase family protein [Altibacter sp.]MCW8982222.1 agmatine deiminase family protein [Altibacter sp.]MCW9037966.1 agmatine deiminase family protein [Altibacter sp.]